MLPVKVRRVFLARHRVDFRKGADGLQGEAYRLGADPYSGDCVLFVKRDQTQLRALVDDGIGLYLVTRRFEGGRLRLLQRFSERPTGEAISTGEREAKRMPDGEPSLGMLIVVTATVPSARQCVRPNR